MKPENEKTDFKKLRESNVHGIEFYFDWILLVLRRFSLSYWLKSLLPSAFDQSGRHKRDNFIDGYCVLQLAILILLLFQSSIGFWTFIGGTYIAFEIYLNLLNIIFVGKIETINAPPSSIERSVLLLMLNAVQTVCAFAIFYRYVLSYQMNKPFWEPCW